MAEAQRYEQRAQWCEGQAEHWRLKGMHDLAEAYRKRAEDWRAKAGRLQSRSQEERD